MLIMNEAKVLAETKDTVEITAPGKTDFFIDDMGGIEKSNAPFYYEKVKGDFVFSAKVAPEFARDYDAGGLFVMDSLNKWIKLEFERTDLGYNSVVSVVTDGTSDDCNGERLEGRESVFLQIARKSDHWALHWSLDGRKWSMARYFKLKMKAEVKVGLEAQSPQGRGCLAVFSNIKIKASTVANMRKGR